MTAAQTTESERAGAQAPPVRMRGERVADAVANAAAALFFLVCVGTGAVVIGDIYGYVTLTEREVDMLGLAFLFAVLGLVGFLLRWALERSPGRAAPQDEG